MKGKGTDVGPDLSQIGRKDDRRVLLNTIMNPSAGMAPEYVPHLVETGEGRVYAGFVQRQTDQEIVLKAIDGSAVQIAKTNVVEIVKQNVSLMPELALKNVTAQDAADLLDYLANLQAVEVHALSFKLAGPFPDATPEDRSTDFGPEKLAGEIDLTAEYSGLGGKRVGWTDKMAQMGGMGLPAIDLRQIAAALEGPRGACRLLLCGDTRIGIGASGDAAHRLG